MTKTRQSRRSSARLSAEAYSALIDTPGLTQESLAATLSRPTDNIGDALEQLERAGYARRQPSASMAWEARDTQAAQVFRIGQIRKLMEEIVERLDASEALAGTILASPKPFSFLQQDVEGVSQIPNAFSAYTLVSKMNSLTRKNAASILTKIPTADELDVSFSEEQEMRARGITARTIFPEEAVNLDYVIDYAEKVHNMGGEIRVSPATTFRLLMWDTDAALIRASSQSADSVRLFLENPLLVTCLAQYFELLWHEAVPIFDQSKITLNEHQRNVIKGLLGGKSESEIAETTGLSPSTIHRTIDHLQKLAGVSGRFALGVAAERRGWITTKRTARSRSK